MEKIIESYERMNSHIVEKQNEYYNEVEVLKEKKRKLNEERKRFQNVENVFLDLAKQNGLLRQHEVYSLFNEKRNLSFFITQVDEEKNKLYIEMVCIDGDDILNGCFFEKTITKSNKGLLTSKFKINDTVKIDYLKLKEIKLNELTSHNYTRFVLYEIPKKFEIEMLRVDSPEKRKRGRPKKTPLHSQII